MDGVFRVSRTFDTVGSMAKTVQDVANLVQRTLSDVARSKLPTNGYQDHLVKGWEGIRVGFVDPDKWRLPETLVKPDEGVLSQTVGPLRTLSTHQKLIEIQKQALEDAVKKIGELGGKAVYPIDVRHPSTFAGGMKTVIGK